MEIFNAVYADDYRIIHIAAHGHYQDDPAQSGVVIGPDRYLTAHDLAKLPVKPDLVFLNCCHLGRVDASGMMPFTTPGRGERHLPRTAANLAVTLIEKGVRCVVAAGWPVGDVPGRRFAQTFYEQMLQGEVLGQAVRRARNAAYDEDQGETNTWGAYQCYGDPGFRLNPGQTQRTPLRPPATEQELRRRVREFPVWVQKVRGEERQAELESSLDRLRGQLPQAWRKAPLLSDFARAYADLLSWSRAIEFYREAIAAWDSELSVAAYEQLANLEMREAIRLWREHRERRPESKRLPRLVSELRSKAGEDIKRFAPLDKTPERLELQAGHTRRLALLESAEDRIAESIRAAADLYREAHESNEKKRKLDPYPTLNWLALASLLKYDLPGDEEQLIERCRKTAAGMSSPYWGRIAEGNSALVLALVQDEVPDRVDLIREAFRPAFGHRSSYRQRSSVIEGTEDLADLHGDEQQAEAIREVVEALKKQAEDAR
jgi:tetratricopeptide (TPR) repeat protein